MTSGRPRVSNGGISWGIARMTAPMEPRCWKTLTRNRPTPMIVWAVSSSFSASKRSRRPWVRIRYTISRICSLSTRPRPLDRPQRAVDADRGRQLVGKVKVRRAVAHRVGQQLVDVQGAVGVAASA